MLQRGSKWNILFFIGFTLMLSAGAIWSIWQGNPGIESMAAFETEGIGQTKILLKQDGSRVEGSGAEVYGNRIEITRKGTYQIAGTLEDGQIHVAAGEAETVTLVLSGAEVSNASGVAVEIVSTGKTELILAEGTKNRIQSGEVREISSEADEESESTGSKGAIYTDCDLSIQGAGSLEVLGYLNNGIHATGSLVIDSGSIRVEAVNHGIKGKKSVTVREGEITILSGRDGIKSDQDTGEEYGWISLEGGSIQIESQGDGVQAETTLEISGGTYKVTAGGGSENGSEGSEREEIPPGRAGGGMPEFGGEPPEFGEEPPEPYGEPSGFGKEPQEFMGEPPEAGQMPFERGEEFSESEENPGGFSEEPNSFGEGPNQKGGQSDGNGNKPDSEREAFKQRGDSGFPQGMEQGSQTEEAEDAEISTKGFKCGARMYITGGSFSVDTQDDAFHSDGSIRITGGDFVIASGDDGIHGNEELTIEEGAIQIDKCYEGLEANQLLIQGGDISITSSDDGVNAYGGSTGFGMGESNKTTEEMPNFQMTGGRLTINAGGDGLDSNGNILIEGGEILVDGPANDGNGAIDSGSENGGICKISGGTILAVGCSGMGETFDEASEQHSFCHNFSQSFEEGEEIRIVDSKGRILYSHRTAKSGNSIVFSCEELKEGETYTLYVGEQSVQIPLNSVSTLSGEQSRFSGMGGRGGDMAPQGRREKEGAKGE